MGKRLRRRNIEGAKSLGGKGFLVGGSADCRSMLHAGSPSEHNQRAISKAGAGCGPAKVSGAVLSSPGGSASQMGEQSSTGNRNPLACSLADSEGDVSSLIGRRAARRAAKVPAPASEQELAAGRGFAERNQRARMAGGMVHSPDQKAKRHPLQQQDAAQRAKAEFL